MNRAKDTLTLARDYINGTELTDRVLLDTANKVAENADLVDILIASLSVGVIGVSLSKILYNKFKQNRYLR